MNRALTCDEAQWTYFTGPTTCIYSLGRNSRQRFSMFYDRIKTNNVENPEATKNRICQQLSEYQNHTCKCKYCKEIEKDYDEPPTSINILEE